MTSFLGRLSGLLRPKGVSRLTTVAIVLALAGAPALAEPDQLLALPAQNDQQAPGDDSEDTVPDAVHCSRPAPVRHASDPTTERRAEPAASGPTPLPSHLAYTTRSAVAGPPGHGAGVRLRC
jgi:hypothetical protein